MRTLGKSRVLPADRSWSQSRSLLRKHVRSLPAAAAPPIITAVRKEERVEEKYLARSRSTDGRWRKARAVKRTRGIKAETPPAAAASKARLRGTPRPGMTPLDAELPDRGVSALFGAAPQEPASQRLTSGASEGSSEASSRDRAVADDASALTSAPTESDGVATARQKRRVDEEAPEILPSRLRGFGATRRDVIWTLVALVALLLLLQHQLRDGQNSSKRRGRDEPSLGSAVASRNVPSSSQSQPSVVAEPISSTVSIDPRSFGARIVDPLGRPVAGAGVKFASQEVVSDATGSFRLLWGTGEVRLSHPRFWTRQLPRSELERLWHQTGGRFEPQEGSELQLPEILLLPGQTIRGTVSRLGAPVRGARVSVSSGGRRHEVRTDAAGKFTSRLLQPDGASLLVMEETSLPVFRTMPTNLTWHHELKIELKSGAASRIAVRDIGQDPVPDAEVWLRAANGDEEFFGWTDDLGKLFTAIPAKRFATIAVKAPGYHPASTNVAADVQLTLRPTPVVRGQAVRRLDGLGAVLRRAALEIEREDAYSVSPDRGQALDVPKPGSFRIGLPPYPGTYRVVAESADGALGYSETFVFDGRSSPPPLLVRLQPRTKLFGIVRTLRGGLVDQAVELLLDPQAPLDDETIHGVRVPLQTKVVRRATTQADGRFSFNDVPAGRYRIRVHSPGWGEYISPPFEPPLENAFPILLGRGAYLAGTVVNAAAQPEARQPLVISDGGFVRRVAWTDELGNYEIPDLPPGNYRLSLGATAGRNVEHRDLSLEEGADVFLRIRRRSG